MQIPIHSLPLNPLYLYMDVHTLYLDVYITVARLYVYPRVRVCAFVGGVRRVCAVSMATSYAQMPIDQMQTSSPCHLITYKWHLK